MNIKKKEKTLLESMPDDILMVVVSKVGTISSIDYLNTITSCKSLHFGIDNQFIAKKLNLAPLIRRPLLAYEYEDLMEKCLESNNASANYIKGLLELFNRQNQVVGIHHLRLAYTDGHNEARFIYGVVLLSLGMTEKGIKIINRLSEEVGLIGLDILWTSIRTTLEHSNVTMGEAYVTSLRMIKPVISCYPHETNVFCPTCFYLFFMSDFFDYITGLNSI